jgi:hypothetical protein
MKQPPLPGLAPPAQPDIEEAATELVDLKDELKAEHRRVILPLMDRIKNAEDALRQRMLEAKVPKHRLSANGNYIDIELTLTEPSVRVRVTGGDADD